MSEEQHAMLSHVPFFGNALPRTPWFHAPMHPLDGVQERIRLLSGELPISSQVEMRSGKFAGQYLVQWQSSAFPDWRMRALLRLDLRTQALTSGSWAQLEYPHPQPFQHPPFVQRREPLFLMIWNHEIMVVSAYKTFRLVWRCPWETLARPFPLVISLEEPYDEEEEKKRGSARSLLDAPRKAPRPLLLQPPLPHAFPCVGQFHLHYPEMITDCVWDPNTLRPVTPLEEAKRLSTLLDKQRRIPGLEVHDLFAPMPSLHPETIRMYLQQRTGLCVGQCDVITSHASALCFRLAFTAFTQTMGMLEIWVPRDKWPLHTTLLPPAKDPIAFVEPVVVLGIRSVPDLSRCFRGVKNTPVSLQMTITTEGTIVFKNQDWPFDTPWFHVEIQTDRDWVLAQCIQKEDMESKEEDLEFRADDEAFLHVRNLLSFLDSEQETPCVCEHVCELERKVQHGLCSIPEEDS